MIFPAVLEAGSVLGIIVAVFVLVFTLAKTVRQVRQASTLRLKTTLSTILLRDGETLFSYSEIVTKTENQGSMFFLSDFTFNLY